MSEPLAAGVVVVVLAAAAVWLGALLPARWWRAPALGVVVGLLATGTWAAMALRDLPTPEAEVAGRPIAVPPEGYVSSSACQACHPREHATWHDSYHRRMTQVASRQSVVGDFDDVTLHYHGFDYRLFWEGDQPWFETSAAALGGDPADTVSRPLALTTGSHHLQAYWYPAGTGRAVEFFPFIFMIPERRWAPRESVFLQPTVPLDAPLAPIDEATRWQHQRQWNHNCLHCHATRPAPGFPGPDTRVAEMGIACEACHGPGEEHARRNRDPLHRARLRAREAAGATLLEPIVDPGELDARRSAQVCGQCHSINFAKPEEWQRKLAAGTTFRPGDELTDTHHVCRASEGEEALARCDNQDLEHQYWSDGMLRVSGREYVGLLDSPCAQRGELTCLSCHTMHQADDDPRPRQAWANDQLGALGESNASCTQCHAGLEAPAALAAHSHHRAASTGSACLDCHMTYTSYGLLKATRSHQISSPSVASSLETGRPNPCNQCHLDKSLAWSAEHLERWYGQQPPALDEVERAVPAALLWLLSGDAGQRALMAWSLGWEPALDASDRRWMPPFLIQLLDDPYDAVRIVAARALKRHPELAGLEVDPLAPPAVRRQAMARALDTWRALPADLRRDALSLLDDPEGRLGGGEVFVRLLRQRDDRVVILTE
ncbi:MAG TPA: multiheme c-type cytochrome [Thermoanaerobaculia bacterium]|nr:multiheme c-type cytochrome [Thermoanaerobaculia bacterium]